MFCWIFLFLLRIQNLAQLKQYQFPLAAVRDLQHQTHVSPPDYQETRSIIASECLVQHADNY